MAQVQKTGSTVVVVPAPIEAVWRVVGDVTRTGEWSHECQEVRWLDGAEAAAPGVRFRGRNRAGWAGWARWRRTCQIVAVDEPREIAWQTVPTPIFPDSTVWRIRLEPVDEMTRIVQEFEVVRAPKVLDHLYAAVIPAHQDRNARLAADLQRLGAVAVRSSEPDPISAGRDLGRPNRPLTRMGNRIGVWLYRGLDGRMASHRKGATVLLLTVAGRRTGLPRSTCVRYLTMDDGWLVWGTGSGSRRDPDWFENLRVADVATVQMGARVLRVRPRELLGEERDRTWRRVVLAQAPEVEDYARRAGRPIPIAALTAL